MAFCVGKPRAVNDRSGFVSYVLDAANEPM